MQRFIARKIFLNIRKKGLEGDQSKLFWHFVRCLEECQPRFFVLENVASMNKEDQEIISETLGVEPILINSNLFTAQNRKRLFWCGGFNIADPVDPHLQYNNSLSNLTREIASYIPLSLTELMNFIVPVKRQSHLSPDLSHNLRHDQKTLDYLFELVNIKGHSRTKTRLEAFPYFTDSAKDETKCIGSYMSCDSKNVLLDRRFNPPQLRKFAVEELELLQGFPPGYTALGTKLFNTQNKGDNCKIIKNGRRIRAIGNAVTVPVIIYIMLNLEDNIKEPTVP